MFDSKRPAVDGAYYAHFDPPQLPPNHHHQVWDIRNHKCMQTFHDDEVYRPENLITSMMYDHSKRWLVTGNLKLKVRGGPAAPCGGGWHLAGPHRAAQPVHVTTIVKSDPAHRRAMSVHATWVRGILSF